MVATGRDFGDNREGTFAAFSLDSMIFGDYLVFTTNGYYRGKTGLCNLEIEHIEMSIG
jgi:hypothetical protein